jgi:hypothetical protein
MRVFIHVAAFIIPLTGSSALYYCKATSVKKSVRNLNKLKITKKKVSNNCVAFLRAR